MNILQGSTRFNNQISLVKNGLLLCCCNSIITSQITSITIHMPIYTRSYSRSIHSSERYLYQIICPNINGRQIRCHESSLLCYRSYIYFWIFLYSIAFLVFSCILANNLYYSCSYYVCSYLLFEMVVSFLNPKIFD